MLFKRCGCDSPTTCPHPYQFKFMQHGQVYQGSTKTANVKLADKIETRRKNAALEDREGLAPRKTWKLSAHVVDYIEHTKHHATGYKNQVVLDALMDVVGTSKTLDKITPFDIERWKSSRVAEVGQSTVNRELTIIRGCFTTAVLWKRIVESPARSTWRGKRAGVDSYKTDDQRVRTLDDHELTAVLAIPDKFVVLVCRATLESLARISELLSLHRSHIGASWVERRLKGGRVIRVPVTPELRKTLLDRCHAVSGFVFGEGETGMVPTQQTASNRVLRALQMAGIEHASHHTMRHTGVTLMLEKGVNPRVIQTLAGWSSLRMLERYGHPRDAEAVRATRTIASHLEVVANLGTP